MNDKLITIKVSDVKIKSNRFREEFSNIDSLAKSIQEVGQIVPIIIDQDNYLIAGERRIRAHQLLKKETIDAIVKTAYELDCDIVEIVENLEREDFNWQEKVLAIDRLHEILSVKNPEWNLRQTAEKAKKSLGALHQEITLAKTLKENPLIFEKCKNKSDALILMKKLMIDETLNEISKRAKHTNYGIKANDIIFHGSCLDLIKHVKDASVDAIISDPFYGIDIQDSKRHLSARGERIYEDSAENYISTMTELISSFTRITKPNSSVVLFCAIQHFYTLYKLLSDVGYQCDIQPAIWFRNGSPGQTQRPELFFARSYEVFIYGHRGNNTLLKQGQPNIFSYSAPVVTDKLHPVQKPLALMEEIITRFCLPGATILDPFAGSGTTLVAAIKRGCKSVGFELEERYFNMGIHRITTALAAKDGGSLAIIE